MRYLQTFVNRSCVSAVQGPARPGFMLCTYCTHWFRQVTNSQTVSQNQKQYKIPSHAERLRKAHVNLISVTDEYFPSHCRAPSSICSRYLHKTVAKGLPFLGEGVFCPEGFHTWRKLRASPFPFSSVRRGFVISQSYVKSVP